MFASLFINKESIQKNTSITYDGKSYSINTSNELEELDQNREEIILWEEDFESDVSGWNTGSGWNLTTDEYNSETHSMHSPNDESTECAKHDLLSPVIAVPQLGDGETMKFGFYIKCDLPDVDSNNDDYVDDYYQISILDINAEAWHASSTDALDGNSYWCGDEEVGGYLDSWIQFLDTPSFTVPSGGELTADMMWTIESSAAATVSGSCTDGWDAANVRISSDGGETWALLNGSVPYDFDCGNGWIYNDVEYDTGGSLNHLAAGWGNNKDWHNASFDLGDYSGQDVIVRFAFGSDRSYCTLDDSDITGFHVDNIFVSGALDCRPENNCDTSVSGDFWVNQFYDYGDTGRPGYQAWEEYVPGNAYNGNVFMDISEFAEKDIIFKVQSIYDGQGWLITDWDPYQRQTPYNRDCSDDGPQGDGLFIDDIKIYKISGGNYPAPIGLTAVPGDGEATLSWYDMNASGTDDFVYHNGSFSDQGGIILTAEGTAWAGERFDIFGASTVNSVSVYSINSGPVDVSIGGFGQLGTLFITESMYSMDVTLQPGENTFDVSWDMNNAFIIGYTFTNVISAGLDSSPNSENSMVSLGYSWDPWSDYDTDISPGEWGVSANITYAGADVSYNLYRDDAVVSSGITSNSHTDTGLTNNTTYEYMLTATYLDGEESEESDAVTVTPIADSVHEEGYDDGSFEAEFNSGSGNFSAVRFSAGSSGEDIIRFKWFQNSSGGAFYIKAFEDDGGRPGSEIYSSVQASGNIMGWNEKDLTAAGLVVSGDFWIGTKEFNSTRSFGLDTSSDSGNSYQRAGSSGDWTSIGGNLAYRIFLDCGDNCDEGCTYASGDVSGDGIVNVLDVVYLVNAILGNTSLGGCALETADMSGDGLVNVIDIVILMDLILYP